MKKKIYIILTILNILALLTIANLIVKQTIEVVDIEKPVITLEKNPDYYTKLNEAYIEEGYKAFDNCDGNITSKVIVTKDQSKIYYTVSDNAGNTTTIFRDIPYDDRTAPTITLNGEAKIEVYVNTNYEELGAIALDDIDGDITNKIEIDSNLDITTIGTYVIKYSAKDNYNNETTIIREVVVKDIDNAYREKELKKVIYLTFDDGPGPYTKELLDTLDKYNVKATFFVCNTDYIDLISEEYKRGHSIGIHAYTHDYSKVYKNIDAYYEDLNKMSDIIYEQTGERTNLIRFPGGSSINRSYTKSLMKVLANDVQEKGYQYFDWNVSSGDGAATGTTEGVYDLVTKRCAKHYINVVLQHDIKKWSVDAVEDIIKWGLANGYTFLPLDETSFPAHHGSS